MQMSRQHEHGQSLTEYGVIAALIAVVSVGGILALNDGIQEGMDSLFSRGNSGPAPLTPVLAATSLPSSSLEGTTGGNPAQAQSPTTTNDGTGTGNVNLTLSNGQTLALDINAVDTGQMIETAGANGATQLLASQLEQVAQQLLAQNLVTPAEASQLTALANQAYKYAEIQSILMEQTHKYGTDVHALYDNPIKYNGKTYIDPDDLANLLGETNTGPGAEMLKMESLMKSVQKLPIMQEASIKTLVNLLSGQVYDIGQSVENTYDGEPYPESFKNFKEATSSIKNNYEKTSNNAGTICTMGNGKANGVSCGKNPNVAMNSQGKTSNDGEDGDDD